MEKELVSKGMVKMWENQDNIGNISVCYYLLESNKYRVVVYKNNQKFEREFNCHCKPHFSMERIDNKRAFQIVENLINK